MNNPKSANGITGVLLPVERTWVFRVYHDNGEFTDYDIYHSDLQVTINDADAYFYEREKGELYLDHSPQTLGIKNGLLDL
jgi:hypothetical protein